MRELAFIDWLRGQCPADPRVLVGPGDDCAVLGPSDQPWLVTTDMLLEGCHFELAKAGAERVGRKALAVNLSDIAAMAGIPRAAVVSIGLPRHTDTLALDFYRGLRDLADAFDTAIIGGDTNSWDSGMAVCVTLLGQPTPPGPILRKGARSGDWLLVTGALGGSILGRHYDFTPRVREAQELQRTATLHAMIDISDGLAQDAHHLCVESGCGAVLFAEAIPIHDDAHKLSDAKSPLEHALGDGEDFELALAVAPDDGRRLLATQPIAGITLYHVGEFQTEGYYLEVNGQRRPLAPRGYEHEF